MDLVIPKGVYHRANGNLPPFELVNMLPEETPSARGGVSLLSFPGLATSTTIGANPILGIFRQDDLFTGSTFVCNSSGTVYKDGVSIGTVDGSGPVWWAASNLELCVGRGAHAYSYNGTTFSAITFPDGANVLWGTYIAGLFIFARSGSRKFYWSAVDDARTIDALDFASAESDASFLVQVLAIGDVLYNGCGDKVEAWYPTGDGTLPFLRISQRTAKKGIIAPGCMVELDNALHFLSTDHVTYRMADVPERISNHGIEEQVANSTTFALFAYYWQGHAVLMERLDTASYGYDVLTGQWHERRTDGVTNWAASSAFQQADGTPLFGASTGPELLEYSGWAEGASVLSREFSAAIPLTSSQIVDSIELECNSGATTDLTITNPVIEMRYSRDGGNTWSDWNDAALGSAPVGGTGHYRVRAKWRRLGSFGPPGALFHFRVTDAVPFRVSSAFGEESSAGRARA
jgi:hypothetical protein